MPHIERLNKPEGKFQPPPRAGHGMDETLREGLLRRMNAGTNVFVVINDGEENEVYGQWMDVLEASEHFATLTGTIRIYPIEAYERGTVAVQNAMRARP